MIRYEFFNESIRESDLHPDALFRREQELARAFVEGLPAPSGTRPCPVCGALQTEPLFQKWGWPYALCGECWSVVLAAEPDSASLQAYFHTSPLARFRGSAATQEAVSGVRTEVWDGQAEWVEGRIRRHLGMDRYRVCDFGSRFAGWVERLQGCAFVDRLSVRRPLPPLCESDADADADVVCLLDVVQRVVDPGALFASAAAALRPGGLLVLSCRSGSGFDILTLRGASGTVFPLDHLCLPSPGGMQGLLSELGLEVLEVTTPGLLDVSLVRKAAAQLSHDQYFARYLVQQESPVLERFQGFLQQNNLSSHLRVVARKRR